MNWYGVAESVEASRKLLEALWEMDADAIAAGVEKAHEEISILQYNDENSLSCTIHLAFYFAREYYTMVRELPAGKGFADVCMIPRPHHRDKPAIVIELKCDKSAVGAPFLFTAISANSLWDFRFQQIGLLIKVQEIPAL